MESCPVLQHPFTAGGPGRPISLPCGHSVSHSGLAALQMLDQNPTAVIRCPVCSMPFNHTPTSENSAATSSSGPAANAPGDCPPSSRGSSPPAAIQPPRSSGSLLPIHPHLALLPPVAPTSGRSASPLWDDDSPMVQSAAAVADLFPQEPWLQRRLHLPVAVEDLIPALRGKPVAKAAWMQLVARYRLPQSMLMHRLNAESGHHPLGPGCSSRRAHLIGDPAATPLGILHCPPLSPSAAGSDSSTPTHAQQAVSLPDLQAAVAPHVALQLLPTVWQHMQPLLGYILADDGAGDDLPNSSGGPRVSLLYAEQGMRLPEYLRRKQGHRADGTPVHAWQLVVDILRQLAGVLAALHSHGFCLSQLCPFRYSTIFMHTAPGAQHATVKLSMTAAPADISDPAHIRRADALCTPPEEAAGGPAGGPAADVWRSAAAALLALAAHHLPMVFDGSGGAQKSDVLRRLCADAPCDLFSILQSCLQEDPAQRWTAQHMAAALASIPAVQGSQAHPPGSQLSDAKPPPAPSAAPRGTASVLGGLSSFSTFAPATPQSFGVREASADFARVRVHRPDTEIVGIAAQSQLPALVHVRPVSPGGEGHSRRPLTWRNKLLLFLAPLTLIVIVPVIITRLAIS